MHLTIKLILNFYSLEHKYIIHIIDSFAFVFAVCRRSSVFLRQYSIHILFSLLILSLSAFCNKFCHKNVLILLRLYFAYSFNYEHESMVTHMISTVPLLLLYISHIIKDYIHCHCSILCKERQKSFAVALICSWIYSIFNVILGHDVWMCSCGVNWA